LIEHKSLVQNISQQSDRQNQNGAGDIFVHQPDQLQQTQTCDIDGTNDNIHTDKTPQQTQPNIFENNSAERLKIK